MITTLAPLATVCFLSLVFILVIPHFAATKVFMSFLPRDIREAAKAHPDPSVGKQITGYLITFLAAVGYVGLLIFLGADGLRRGYGFWLLFGRFMLFMYGYKLFDILVQDQYIVISRKYFVQFYPETKDCQSWNDRGFNTKNQLIRLIAFPFVCVLMAWITLIIGRRKALMKKTIRNYGKVYRKALTFRQCRDIEAKTAAYVSRLREMYASDNFKAHSVYPTTNTTHVYAVIAMCLELKALGLTDAEIIEAVNHGFARRRDFFRRLIRLIDLLPNSFEIARNWNISDHDKRVKDGSITYDRFDVGQDRIEYSISKCVYVEMFEAYGIRSLCKIFCMTDTTSYENLCRHVTFIRHSDLSDGDACHDEIIRRRKSQ